MKNTEQPTPYPIGTRIAEGYAMDLNREAAEGRPALFGARAQEEAAAGEAPFLLRADTLMLIVGLAAVYAVYRLQVQGFDWKQVPAWLLTHLRGRP